MKYLIALLCVLTLSVGIATADTTSPAEKIQEILSSQREALIQAREQGNRDVEPIYAASREKAKVAVQGVDPNTVNPDEAESWSRLFSMAGMERESVIASEIFLTTNPAPEKAFPLHLRYLSARYADGDMNAIVERWRSIEPFDMRSTATLVSIFTNMINPSLQEVYADGSLQLLEEARGKVAGVEIDEETLTTLTVDLEETRADIYIAKKQPETALEILKTLSAEHQDARSQRSINAHIKRIALTDTQTPSLAFGEQYGDFKSLDNWKGKVVLIDFFSHWCGPCKAAFPSMKELYAEYNPKGLEVVGVTKYYGFYGFSRDKIDEDQEFEKMAGFMDEWQLPWPVIFGTSDNFNSFGVTGIPQLVIIDKNGVIRKIHKGYSKPSFEHVKKFILKLLDE